MGKGAGPLWLLKRVTRILHLDQSYFKHCLFLLHSLPSQCVWSVTSLDLRSAGKCSDILLKRLKHISLRNYEWAECVSLRILMISETKSTLSSADHASLYHYHVLRTYHWWNKRNVPQVSYPIFLYKSEVMHPGRSTEWKADTRQGEVVGASGYRLGKRESKGVGSMNLRGQIASWKVKEMKRRDTYPALRFLATVLWTCGITTGLSTGLPKWVAAGWGLGTVRLEHKKVRLCFLSLFSNYKYKTTGSIFMHYI